MKDLILKELYRCQNQYISGEELGARLGVSRTAIWKHINTLKEEGYAIETTGKKGYRLQGDSPHLLPLAVEGQLKTGEMGKPIHYFPSISSTNAYAKEIASTATHGTVILADEQVAGRGRLGRTWTSPKGEGIFMSIILKPNLPPMEGGKLTQVAAAAVFKAIQEVTGLNPQIKWPNDIVLGGKKVCGILTEMAGELNAINYLVVGIGINVNTMIFPEELEDKATSLKREKGEAIARDTLIAAVLNHFEVLYQDFLEKGMAETLKICREASAVIGKEIKVHQGNQVFEATALAITDDGYLKVKKASGEEVLIGSGEVSVRGLQGYI